MDSGVVMSPKVVIYPTRWMPEKRDDWVKMIGAMVDDEKRNQQIEHLALKLLCTGRQVLILSDRVAHCNELAQRLRTQGVKAEALVGTLSKKKRKDLIQRADIGEIQAITATTIADEGLDLPKLGAVILAVPSKNEGKIQQRIGRVMRTSEGKKTPIVIDLMDELGPMKGMAKKRCRIYRKLGCQFADLDEI